MEMMWKQAPRWKMDPGGRIVGWKDYIVVKRVGNASIQGVQFLKDIRFIEQTYGLKETWSYSHRYLDFEMYILFRSETLLCLCLSVVAVMGVVILVTADTTVTLLVAGVVIITDLFLAALIHFWGLTMN